MQSLTKEEGYGGNDAKSYGYGPIVLPSLTSKIHKKSKEH
jgi:hypothetical protein